MYTPEPDQQRDVFYSEAQWTTCAGTWLAQPADLAEREAIDRAAQALKEQRKLALEFYRDPLAAKQFGLELFSQPAFTPLHLSDALIEKLIANVGEPPIVESPDDPAFANYLRTGVLSIANSKVRRHLAHQLRRFLPQFVQAEQWTAAIAIDNNAFRTSLGNEASPFLVQMTLRGLARYYGALEPSAANNNNTPTP